MRMSSLWCGVSIAVLPPAFVMAGSEPSFDCSRATGTVETTICADDELAALDRELAEVWRQALPRLPESEADDARAFERGWIKGRDDCWKADDVKACVREAYETRITELQVTAGLVEVPDYHAFSCESGDSLRVTFFSNTKAPVAVLTRNGDEQVLAFRVRTASGARYDGRNVSYWEHQGEASLTWMDEQTRCRPSGLVGVDRQDQGASHEHGGASMSDACMGLPDSGAFVVVRSPMAGTEVSSSLTVEGCSRTFESNVIWRLARRDGSAVREGFTSGGGVGGPGPFSFDIDLEGLEAGLYELEVSEPTVTDEEGYPPSRTVLPLVLAGGR